MTTSPPVHAFDRAASRPGAAPGRVPPAARGALLARSAAFPRRVAFVAVVLAGCVAPRPTPPPNPAPAETTPAPSATLPATRLAVLAPRADDGDLVILDDAARVASLPLPAGAAAWISADPAGHLLATTGDGRLFLGAPLVTTGEPGAWHEVVPRWAGDRPAVPLSFGTLAPDGGSIAALAADFSSGTAFDLVLVDAGTRAASVIGIAAWPDGAAPAWLPDGRLVLVARDPARDRTGLVLVDPGRPGPASRFEREAYGIAISADGRVAALDRADGMVAIGPTQLLLRDDAGAGERESTLPADLPSLLVGAPSGTVPGPFALDASGTRLAVAWLDEAGGPATVGRYRLRPEGPVAEDQLTVPGGPSTAVVAWLP